MKYLIPAVTHSSEYDMVAIVDIDTELKNWLAIQPDIFRVARAASIDIGFRPSLNYVEFDDPGPYAKTFWYDKYLLCKNTCRKLSGNKPRKFSGTDPDGEERETLSRYRIRIHETGVSFLVYHSDGDNKDLETQILPWENIFNKE